MASTIRGAEDWSSPPSDYKLVVPQGWFQVSLDPEERDRSIIALAERQFNGVDNAPHIKQRFMRDLQRKTKEARKVGGLELYLSTLMLGPLPLASSLLVSIPPNSGPVTPTAYDLAAALRQGGRDTGVVELASAGTAVREHKVELPRPEDQLGNTLSTTTVTYHVPIPASGHRLMLTFSTPLEPLAPRMVELFDAVAETLHWS
ncbi:hypothetical protein [Streptomyces sp. NPDC047070]|uniref:hypothetical protein n=1 Tax=Streptomyces sp. NPDC047070 TaxID=3154923 RepID=UPI003454D232